MSQALSAAVDNSAMFAIGRVPLIVRGKLLKLSEPLFNAGARPSSKKGNPHNGQLMESVFRGKITDKSIAGMTYVVNDLAQPVLLIQPRAGLANRLRALASAMRAADVSGRRLVIAWRVDDEMGARFEELFESPVDTNVVGLDSMNTVEFHNPIFVDSDLLHNRAVDVLKITAYTAFSCETGIRNSTAEFWDILRPHLHALRPTESIRRQVQGIVGQFGPTMFGVHIRSGSESIWFEKSGHIKIEAFFEAIRQELSEHEQSRLYAACDAVGPMRALLQAFPGRVIALESVFENVPKRIQGDSEAVQMAFVDLLCLAQCGKIIGSYYSSFSQIAAVLGDKPIQYIGVPNSYGEHLRDLLNILRPRNFRDHGFRWIFNDMLRPLSRIWQKTVGR